MRRIILALLAGASLASVSAPALAQSRQAPEPRESVVTKNDPQARERTIATSLFNYWISGNKDGKVETAVADVNGDGTGEIFIRLIDASTCDKEQKVCKVMVLMHDGKEWKVVFDRPAETIELGKPGKDKMRNIVVNGYENRAWNGRFYAIDASSIKSTQLKFQEMSGDRAIETARGFGNSAEKLVSNKMATVLSATAAIGDVQGTFVRLEGAAVCGLYTGCPFRLLLPSAQEGNRLIPVLDASARTNDGKADIRTLQVMRGGRPSILVTTPDGTPLVAEWDGSRYSMETRR